MSKNRKPLVVLGACAALLIALPAGAQNTSTQMDSGTKRMMSSTDTTFAMKAAQGGMAEVKLGQLAVEKGSNPDVKAFGQRMVDDHTKLNDQMKQVASQENMSLPSDLDPKDQAEYQKLSQLSGPAFDRAYMKGMIKDHETDIKEFQKESNTGKDPGIKQLASTALPILQSHLQQAKETEAKVGK